MKVRDVMTSPVVTVRPEATFAEIVDRMLSHRVSGLPVVDADGVLVGIVTEADLVTKEAYGQRPRRMATFIADVLLARDPAWARKARGRMASELMTAAPITVGPDDDVVVAARRMLELGRKRLPVVEDGRVIGIVSRRDLLRQFDRSDAEIAADVTKVLTDIMRVPEDHRVLAAVAGGVVRLRGTVRRPSDTSVIEAAVRWVPGVVGVESCVVAREAEPKVSGWS